MPEQTPQSLTSAIETIEQDTRLDPLVDRLAGVANAVASGPNGPALRGDWLGHALHPLLTDFPLGCWFSVAVLDLLGGKSSRKAAQHLVLTGLAFVPVTAASGLADYASVREPRSRRVGVVHAAGNTAVALCYFRSWRARRRGHYAKGKLWGLAGGSLALFTGYLGGHLSFGRGEGGGLRGMALEGDTIDLGSQRVVDVVEAARLLDVTVDQVQAMVDGDLLVPLAGLPGLQFYASEVEAARLVGG
jgi:uncharacterized membrane protein